MEDIMDSYKICLRTELIDDCKLKIQLIHIDPMAITDMELDSLDYHIYRNKINNFCIWSFGYFFIAKEGLKLPQSDKIKDRMFSERIFDSDDDRKKYLKKLYESLQNWSCDKNIFKNKTSESNIKNISINGQFWFVY